MYGKTLARGCEDMALKSRILRFCDGAEWLAGDGGKWRKETGKVTSKIRLPFLKIIMNDIIIGVLNEDYHMLGA